MLKSSWHCFFVDTLYVTFGLCLCHRLSVCRLLLSVTFMKPTQKVELFGNIFAPHNDYVLHLDGLA